MSRDKGTNGIRMHDVKDTLSKSKERKTEKRSCIQKTIHRKPDYHLLERLNLCQRFCVLVVWDVFLKVTFSETKPTA